MEQGNQRVWLVAVDGEESYYPQAAFSTEQQAVEWRDHVQAMTPSLDLMIASSYVLDPPLPEGTGQWWIVELEPADEDCSLDKFGDEWSGEYDGEDEWASATLHTCLVEGKASWGRWLVCAPDTGSAIRRARELEAATDANE